MNVLIVDDSKAMRMIVRRTLRQAGYERFIVSEAGNGVEAFQAATTDHPALILCDWNMPEMTGLELLHKLKDAGCRSKFGFITSESTDEMHNTALDAGAEFLVTKPFTPDVLKAALRPLFAN